MADTKFSILVLLVDIEKARFLSQNNESFDRLVAICHSHTVDSINQTACFKETIRIAKLDTKIYLNLQVIAALSPVTLRVMLALSSIDPQLEQFSSGATGFIFAENPAYSGIDKELQPLVSNPEAIRQLGRVYLTAALSILDTLTLMARDTKLGNQPGYNNRRSENLAQMRSFMLATLGFVRSWIGPDTLEVILKIYGEDDAGVSWLLMTMSQIEHRFRDMRSKYYQFISEALLILDEFDDMHNHLFEHVHPLEALFKFLESIGYDYQTLLDLILTLDNQQTGGMLAAMMMILRNFIENESDQRKLTERWKRVMAGADEMMRDFSDDLYKDHIGAVAAAAAADLQSNNDDKNLPNNHEGSLLERRAILFGVEFGISQLAHHIRRLHERHLFPYNPRALLVVLDRTQHILLSVISNSSK
ncbi:hypothetical protein BGZ80_004760 [Entomortierella chlamydospora]|uniref:Protein Lines C-terminal domain-containing protein n=1 Tax=Entomortierella chlamydospora TaxID=101097 RepID=A0A9P6SW56_9FUNG|nr:hypothetical protein BGZ79_002118 [Entomortierella chlamydospora]KAG0007350.1 hypothetical protein BGZ80_004760 [Entomortierella chlamydospora]